MSSSIRRSVAFSVVERYASIAFGLGDHDRPVAPSHADGLSASSPSRCRSSSSLADIFRDFGTNNYLLQAKQLSNQQLQSAFTAVLATTTLCALVLLLTTPAIVSLYGDARFWQLMPLFAFNLMLGPFSAIGISLLRRNLAFGTLAGISLLGTAVNFVVVVALASLGHGGDELGLGGALGKRGPCRSGLDRAAVLHGLSPSPCADGRIRSSLESSRRRHRSSMSSTSTCRSSSSGGASVWPPLASSDAPPRSASCRTGW